MTLLLAASLLAPAAWAADKERCEFAGPPTKITTDGKGVLRYWEVDDSPLWTSERLPDSIEQRRFVRYVQARLDVSEPRRYIVPAELPTEADRHNAQLMLAGGIGELKPLNCLEALLLASQMKRRPMETQPTEFLAFVLRRAGERGAARLKIWFYTVDQPGIGRLGPLQAHAERDVAAGWRPILNLHNHNFFFDKTPVVPGAPWPSAIDLQLMKNLTLAGHAFETTAVTNGFTTSRLRPADLKRLRSADAR